MDRLISTPPASLAQLELKLFTNHGGTDPKSKVGSFMAQDGPWRKLWEDMKRDKREGTANKGGLQALGGYGSDTDSDSASSSSHRVDPVPPSDHRPSPPAASPPGGAFETSSTAAEPAPTGTDKLPTAMVDIGADGEEDAGRRAAMTAARAWRLEQAKAPASRG